MLWREHSPRLGMTLRDDARRNGQFSPVPRLTCAGNFTAITFILKGK
ncbi:hypothetical protein FB385_0472 [Paramicrobacterium agarici]|uniref:Uncharacterized protein n=1 Tax=Paramicrobacterium agarici TaxID=630514 RepID=A0A2A9DZG1_9MICO|nr:hypothetical protein ATJ78_2745 [Microbacterium agarici]TQO21663.1 hypothetical protein FB385_0472 [Microbacterium agarici]